MVVCVVSKRNYKAARSEKWILQQRSLSLDIFLYIYMYIKIVFSSKVVLLLLSFLLVRVVRIINYIRLEFLKKKNERKNVKLKTQGKTGIVTQHTLVNTKKQIPKK